MPTTSNFGWTTPADTDLVKDGAAAIRTLGNGIDTSFLDLKGGTTDQVLAKNSNTDLDFKWVAQDDSNAIQNAIVDAKGDLISATAADTPARLAVGANGTVLTADSSEATGLKWVAPAGGGKVLQVVAVAYDTETSTTSGTYADTGLTATITPTLNTSKILVFLNINGILTTGSNNARGGVRLVRGATNLAYMTNLAYFVNSNNLAMGGLGSSFVYSDSPATTSATTYKTQYANTGGAGTMYFQNNNGTNNTTSSLVLLEIGA